MSARTHQMWYRGVSRCGIAPDIRPLSIDEARAEFRLAPFERAVGLAELSISGPPQHGVTRALVSALKEGQSTALALILERCQPRIRDMIRRQLGQPLRSYLESGDVQQEVNLQLMNSIGGFVPTGDDAFINWLYAVVRHTVLNLHRGQRRRPSPGPLDHEPKESGRVEQDCDLGPRIEALERAIEELERSHPDYAAALRMQAEGLPYRLIAARLGRSEAAVGMLLVRARIKLGNILCREQNHEP